MAISIVIADQHPLSRQALRLALDAEPDLTVAGEADDDEQALTLARDHHADVVLLGAHGGSHAAKAVSRVIAAVPSTGVIVIRSFDDPFLLQEVLDKGARGCLLSKATGAEVVAAVRGVYHHPERVVICVDRRCLNGANRSRSSDLSPREQDVLALVAQGFSNSQVGSRLSITEATVKRHLRNIFEKLGATSRTDAVNRARRRYSTMDFSVPESTHPWRRIRRGTTRPLPPPLGGISAGDEQAERRHQQAARAATAALQRPRGDY